MSINCTIELNHPEKVYFSGETVIGRALLTIGGTKSISFQAFWIHFIGKAHCYWNDTSDETYLSKKIDCRENDNVLVLGPGNYFFNFQCELPSTVPSSVEAESGYIRYGAITKLIHSDDTEIEVLTKFTVVKELNISHDLNLAKPVVKSNYRQSSILLCFESESLEMTVRMPVSGYTPGQTINLEFSADNRILMGIQELRAALMRMISYNSRDVSNSTSVESTVIAKQKSYGNPQSCPGSLKIRLDVPPTPPTDIVSSKLLHVEYFVKVYGIVVNGTDLDNFFEIPITIGTLPISETTYSDALTRHCNMIPDNEAVPASTPRVIVAPSAPSLHDLPPTYEEAVGTDKTDNAFKPKYPVFRRNTSYSSNE